MKITLDLRLNVEENAQRYFEAAKKSRRKAKGAEQAVATWTAKAAEKGAVQEKRQAAKRPERKREWYEKFRWCVSSDGFLLVAGKDASTNELIVKRHTLPNDVVLHTDMAGSPFVIVKTEGKEVPHTTLEEAAQFCAGFSRAWKIGLSALEVFHVAPSQVTKEPNPGEFLPKGAFMIRGKTTYLKPLIKVAVGVDAQERVFAGPPSAVLHHCATAYEILQANEKASGVAKELARHLGADLDELLAALPPGGCKLGKRLARPRTAEPKAEKTDS